MMENRKERFKELTQTFISWGVEEKAAARLARRTLGTVDNLLSNTSRDGLGPKHLVEDRYNSNKDIRIFIRSDSSKKPETLLAEFLHGRKGYPDSSRWEIKPRTGGLVGGSNYVATVIVKASPQPKSPGPRTDKQVASFLDNLTTEQAAALMKKFKNL
jgi:hypothetical protein